MDRISNDLPWDEVSIKFNHIELGLIADAVDEYIRKLEGKVTEETERENDRLADIYEGNIDDLQAVKRKLETVK